MEAFAIFQLPGKEAVSITVKMDIVGATPLLYRERADEAIYEWLHQNAKVLYRFEEKKDVEAKEEK